MILKLARDIKKFLCKIVMTLDTKSKYYQLHLHHDFLHRVNIHMQVSLSINSDAWKNYEELLQWSLCKMIRNQKKLVNPNYCKVIHATKPRNLAVWLLSLYSRLFYICDK